MEDVLLTSAQVKELAHSCGFEIAGVTPATPHADYTRFVNWTHAGHAGDLTYLTDRRRDLRADPRLLLTSAQSIICLGKLYNTDRPLSIEQTDPGQGWVSRYAWGRDYHDVLRAPLELLLQRMTARTGAPFESKICVDTAPLLERSYARAAGLGWLGKNTCLINEQYGSWFFLAELLVSLPIPGDLPAPERCGTCSRCVQACPTSALLPNQAGGCDLDARLCISYLTIEKRGVWTPGLAPRVSNHIFGCDICQDVCPWNQRAHRHGIDVSQEDAFTSKIFAPDLAELSQLQEDEFRRLFRATPVWRARYSGFLRNVAVAMGNSGRPALREPLLRLTAHADPTVAETARVALQHLDRVLSR